MAIAWASVAGPVLVGLGCGLFAWAALAGRLGRRPTIRDLVRARDWRRGTERLQDALYRVFPPERAAERLARAGWSLSPLAWAGLRVAALGGLPCLGLAAGLPPALALAGGMAAGWFGPEWVLDQFIDDVRLKIAARVPALEALIATVMTAGAPTVAAAAQRVLDERHELDRLLAAALREADAVGLEAALGRLAVRAGGEEVRRFCAVLARAHSLGAGGAAELRAEATQIRSFEAEMIKAKVKRRKPLLTAVTVLFMFLPGLRLILLPALGAFKGVFNM